MDSTELENQLQALADEAGSTDLGTCLITVIGAMKNDKLDELSTAMMEFTITTVGGLVKDDVAKREEFWAILRQSLMEAMEQ